MAHTLDRFTEVYRKGLWKTRGVLSGEGSMFERNRHLIEWLEREIAAGARSVLDLGCGDLEWISHCSSIVEERVSYYGVDVVPTLIAHHRRVFPWFGGEAVDLEELSRLPEADVVILKDVLPYNCSGRNETQLMALERARWQRLLVTSDPGAINAKRHGIRGGNSLPYDVEEARMATGERILTPPLIERMPRHGGGEFLIYGPHLQSA